MAVAADPNAPEFFVYHLMVGPVPFYVGIGRSSRASDRIRYVKSLIAREARGQPAKWVLSNAVVAGLIQAGHEPQPVYVKENVTRSEALGAEKAEVMRLRAAGWVLANIHHNPGRLATPDEIVQTVLARLATHPE